MIINSLFCLACGFLISFFIAPIVVFFCKKIKAKQTILHYVDAHQSKNGTPTMGGLIFIFGTMVSSFFAFNGAYTFALLCVVVMLAYAVLGFLDDFIKIKEKQNQGLLPYQKIIGQVGISFIIALFVYNFVGSQIIIPFANVSVDIGIFVVPLVILVYVAFVNSVNLIDGLDGLCGGVSAVYLFGFSMVLSLGLQGLTGSNLVETQNVIAVSFCLIGSLLAFLLWNGYPAKIFMGDTGSLAIGGFLSTVAVLTGMELYILILGLPYVLTALSDVIQVVYFKKTKKRVFLMAPLHHHFEKKGIHENKIVLIYNIVTLMIAIITYLIIWLVGK